MTKEKLAEKISEWCEDAGESFTDYFMHDNVNDSDWANWLLSKGFSEKAHEILGLIEEGETCIDQDVLYEVYSEHDDNGKYDFTAYDKNIEVWADFLVSTPTYLKKVIDFFEENN